MLESILCSVPGSYPLLIVIYLDGIAVCRDTQEQVLEDMIEAIKWLDAAGFMLNLCKNLLV